MTGNGDGVLANGVVGGLLEYNLVHDIGGNHNKCGGPVGIWAHNADNVIIQFNEVFRVRPVPSHPGTGCDWNGIGLDAGGGSITNSIVQYNYSHHNGGSGFYHWGAPGSGKNVFRYNIAEENNTNNSNNFGAMSFNGVGITGRVDVYNNTFSQPASPTGNATGVIAWQAYNIRPESGIVANNIIITSKDRFGNAVFMNGGLSDIRQTFANNLYYAPAVHSTSALGQ